jgi:plastocyanin
MLTAHHAEHPGPMPARLVTSAVFPGEGRAAPREPGVIRLLAVPANPWAGERVRLKVMAPPLGAHGYRWRLPGDTASPRSGANVSRVSASFAPGLHRVTVRIVGADRVYAGALILRVRAAANRASKVSMKMPPSRARLGGSLGKRMTPAGARVRTSGSVAHAANDPAVTIVDFRFSPATITVHVGETVTWVNDGSMPHSATARDGSFNTGILAPGHSASHTFTQPGTFSYFCSVHPFMHGTIVVLAKTSTTPAKPTSTPAPKASTTDHPQPPASSPAGSSAGQPATSAPSSSASTLPVTGMNLIIGLACAALLLGSGIGLRRALARWTP